MYYERSPTPWVPDLIYRCGGPPSPEGEGRVLLVCFTSEIPTERKEKIAGEMNRVFAGKRHRKYGGHGGRGARGSSERRCGGHAVYCGGI